MESLPDTSGPKFELGQVVATPGAIELLVGAGRSPVEFIARHVRGEWGDLDEHDRLVNESALQHGGRLLSSYIVTGDQRVWLITESDRSATTLLRPEEY
jgi:hypothetical protein